MSDNNNNNIAGEPRYKPGASTWLIAWDCVMGVADKTPARYATMLTLAMSFVAVPIFQIMKAEHDAKAGKAQSSHVDNSQLDDWYKVPDDSGEKKGSRNKPSQEPTVEKVDAFEGEIPRAIPVVPRAKPVIPRAIPVEKREASWRERREEERVLQAEPSIKIG